MLRVGIEFQRLCSQSRSIAARATGHSCDELTLDQLAVVLQDVATIHGCDRGGHEEEDREGP